MSLVVVVVGGGGMCMYVRGDYDVCGVCVTSQVLLECMPFDILELCVYMPLLIK